MKHRLIFYFFMLSVGMILFQSCSKEDSSDPPKADIFYSVVGKQAAFTALTKRAESWEWDFGDGQSGNEMNPVHVYTDGGYYLVKLTAANSDGVKASAEVSIAVDLTPYVLLTGGPTDANGKTWKLTANHTVNDRLGNADAAFTIADGAPETLPQGVFGLYLGMAEVYDDEFTFFYDRRYSHDVKSDNAAFAGIVNQMITNGGAGIVNPSGASFGLCTASYTPETGATFTYVENEDFAVPSVYGPGGVLTYNGVSTLDFSGTEFIGLLDHQRKVIIQEITDSTMRLVMFMSASADYFPLNTHAIILTFEVVNK